MFCFFFFFFCLYYRRTKCSFVLDFLDEFEDYAKAAYHSVSVYVITDVRTVLLQKAPLCLDARAPYYFTWFAVAPSILSHVWK
uniref:Putative secreted protein synganglion overexpressed n=1 Tax=Rhipicephalus microplus TaxID=6941 RepID=A0A6M2DC16_RHIMP